MCLSKPKSEKAKAKAFQVAAILKQMSNLKNYERLNILVM